MQQRRPARETSHCGVEALQLRLGRAVAPVRRVKMGVAAFEVRRVQQVRDWLDLVPAHARAAHPRVDLQVERAVPHPPRPARDPGADARLVTERRRQPVRLVGIEQIGPGRHEHEYGPRDPRRPQISPLLDRRDAVPPRVDRLQSPGNGDGSHPVGIRFHHREEPCAGDPGHRAGVLDNGGEAHLDPRTGEVLTPAD